MKLVTTLCSTHANKVRGTYPDCAAVTIADGNVRVDQSARCQMPEELLSAPARPVARGALQDVAALQIFADLQRATFSIAQRLSITQTQTHICSAHLNHTESCKARVAPFWSKQKLLSPDLPEHSGSHDPALYLTVLTDVVYQHQLQRSASASPILSRQCEVLPTGAGAALSFALLKHFEPTGAIALYKRHQEPAGVDFAL